MTIPVALPQPYSERHVALPYDAYRGLLEAGPLHKLEIAPGLKAWVVCGYETNRTLMADARLSIDPASTTAEIRALIDTLATEEKQSLYGRHLLATDPPDHDRMRRVMSRALTARRLRAMEPRVQQITDGLVEELAGRTEADLLTEFALPLTIRVLAELIGLPDEGARLFRELGLLVLSGHAADGGVFGHVISTLAAYLKDLRQRPESIADGGLMHLLLGADARGEISDAEFDSLLFQLFFAGHESTGYFIANALAALLAHPEQLERLRREPELLDRAIEELLRYEGSVKSATWRFPTEPIEVEGVRIGRGEPVLMLFAAANRDPGFVDDPDRLDITRPAPVHMSFGHGVHHCLGHALGRMEARAAIASLTARYPDMRLRHAYADLPWRRNMVMRGVSSLPVVLCAD